MDEELSDKIDLLLRVTSADVERRLINEVIKHMTDDDRKAITAAVVDRAVRLVADGAIDDMVRRHVVEWTGKEAVAAANARWGTVKVDITAKVSRHIEACVTPEKVGQIVDSIVPGAMRAAVVDKVNEALRLVRGGK